MEFKTTKTLLSLENTLAKYVNYNQRYFNVKKGSEWAKKLSIFQAVFFGKEFYFSCKGIERF